MKRVLLAGLLLALVGAGGAPRQTAAGNRLLAERDAEHLLRSVALPPGAVGSSTDPAGDDGLLRSAVSPAGTLLVDRHRWWTVQASFQSVLEFVETHRPAGAAQPTRGYASAPGTPPNYSLGFSLAPIPGVIAARDVQFSIAGLRGGGTGIRVDAQDIWVLPRPRAERIPAGVRLIVVTSARAGRGPRVSLAVTDAGQVRHVVRLVDSLQTVQPGVWSCPVELGAPPMTTLEFLAGANRPALAHLSVAGAGGGDPCDPIGFSVRGHQLKPLLDGDFLNQLQHLLHIRLA